MLTFKYNNKLKAKIVYAGTEAKSEFDRIRDEFKCDNPAARFSTWGCSPWHYAITALGTFNIGMLDDILEKCRLFGIETDVDKKLLETARPSLKINEILPVPNEKYKYRDYQLELIKALSDNGRGVIVSPTRSGKSLVIAGLIRNVFENVSRLKIQNVLILVPNIQLVYQFAEDLEEYGLGKMCNIQAFTAGTMNKKGSAVKIDKLNVYVANLQYILLHGDELPYIDMLFMDEVHTGKKGNQISKMVGSLDIIHKFGCTGTLPESQIDKWSIIGQFGRVVDEIEIQSLQEKKFLADVQIYPVKFIHDRQINFKSASLQENLEEGITDPLELSKRAFSKEKMYLDTLEDTNSKTMKIVQKVMSTHPDWNALVLFDFLEQGKGLYDKLEWTKKFYVDGSIDIKKRLDAVGEMDKSGGSVLVAQTKTFSTGITISRLNVIFLLNAGKSATKIIQSIGRGLRRQNKDAIAVFDFFHSYPYSEKHFNERTKLYQKFYGLNIGVNYSVKNLKCTDCTNIIS